MRHLLCTRLVVGTFFVLLSAPETCTASETVGRDPTGNQSHGCDSTLQECSGVEAFARHREAALRMVQAYVSATTNSSTKDGVGVKPLFDMGTILEDVKMLLHTSLSQEVIDDILAEAIKQHPRSTEQDSNPNSFQEENNVQKEDQHPDRFIRDMEVTLHDPDCMTREFNLANESTFDPQEAIHVYRKCKLLVLRNAFDKSFLQDYRQNFTEYIHGLHTGRIRNVGRTSNGENYFMHQISHKRWEVLLPPHMAQPDLVAHPAVLEVLKDEGILGDEMVLHSLGTAIAESGAEHQPWHADESYLFSDKSLQVSGIGGHDLPSYAVTMMIPLVRHMTPDHGPTEFCMGTSYLSGLDMMECTSHDPSLSDASSLYRKLRTQQSNGECPPEFQRIPQLQFGDLLLFDYQLMHRGGHNKSPDMRSIMYMTYSRYWYKDTNFDNSFGDFKPNDIKAKFRRDLREGDPVLRRLLRSARFAIPEAVSGNGDDQSVECDEDCRRGIGEDFELESVTNFLHGERSLPRTHP